MLLNFLIWGVVGLLAGLVCFLAVPVLVGPVLPPAWRQRVGDFYGALWTMALDRGGFVGRKSGGIDLAHSAFDAELEREKVPLDGEDHYYKDPGGRMSRLYNRPIGLWPEDGDLTVSPLDCALGRADERAAREYGNENVVEVDGEAQQFIRDQVHLPRQREAVQIRDVLPILTNAASPKLPDITETFVEHSQSGFGSRDIVGLMTMGILGAMGFGMTWFAFTQVDKVAPAGGVTVPIAMDMLGVML
jgi:hypothetical protein